MSDSGTAEPRRAALEPVVVDQLPDPVTGELVDATPENVAFFWCKAQEAKRFLEDYMRNCIPYLVEESRLRGTQTLHFDDVTLELTGGTVTEYRREELIENLTKEGCPRDRVEAAVKPPPVDKWAVDRRVLKQLAAANENYAVAIELASYEEEKRRGVRRVK